MAKVVMTLRLADVERFRLFLWELRQIADKMRVEACPHGEALEHAVERFLSGERGDQPEEPDRG